VISLAAIKKEMAYYGGFSHGDFLHPFEVPYYWMDFGNMMDRGQVVLGTLKAIEQPKESEFKCLSQLKTIDKLHPDILIDKKGDDQGPSCSLAEALQKQDLFINTNLANMGLGILWKMFRELRIRYHGVYLNLETMSVNPIKI
jgi:PRTRC genetic system ThiF family protein